MRYFIFFLCFISLDISASLPTKEELLHAGIPLVEITTINSEEPTCDYVSAPEGAVGESIANATKVGGRMKIWMGEDLLYDSGDYLQEKSGMTVKIHGNTSAFADKKSFKVKLQKKSDLLFRGAVGFKDKDWLLIRTEIGFEGDHLLNTMIGKKVSELTGMPYTPQNRFVNVMFNGDYRGLYMLSETVSRNESCRINVDKDEGYIIEKDPYWWNTSVSLLTSIYQLHYTIKYPDSDKISESMLDEIQYYLEQIELGLLNGTYAQYIDVESLARWTLTHDILGTADAGGSNIFLTRHDTNASTKMAMGPLWDFDSIMQTDDQWSRVHGTTDGEFYIYELFYKYTEYNTPLTEAYHRLWNQYKDTLFDSIVLYLNDFRDSVEGKAVELSQTWDDSRWVSFHQPFSEIVDKAINWFTHRRQWMEMTVCSTPVITAPAFDKSAALNKYDLAGRHINSSYRGVTVSKKGKKTQASPYMP